MRSWLTCLLLMIAAGTSAPAAENSIIAPGAKLEKLVGDCKCSDGMTIDNTSVETAKLPVEQAARQVKTDCPRHPGC